MSGDAGQQVSTRVYAQPLTLIPNTSPLAIAKGSTADGRYRADGRHERGDIHVTPEVPWLTT